MKVKYIQQLKKNKTEEKGKNGKEKHKKIGQKGQDYSAVYFMFTLGTAENNGCFVDQCHLIAAY